VKVIQQVLKEFECLSGLKANPSKSSIFFAGASRRIKHLLLSTMQMKEGVLPIRYLGVPLISSRLIVADCQALIMKITSRIDSWISKSLTFAGRLQLISSILYSIHVYWSSVFILPKKIIKAIEKKFIGSYGMVTVLVLQKQKLLRLIYVILKKKGAWG
jgi:hypothetical protein